MRLRFEERELELLRGSEQLRGARLAQNGRPDGLRTALTLAKAGNKLRRASAGALISLDENELDLLLEAVRLAVDEVPWATNPAAEADPARRDSVFAAFPELVEKGLWRGFAVTRDLQAVAERLRLALHPHS
ncbi:MAG: hypothetical protein JOZ81_25730 [Chloroflexi bacterium]|nr:hypothetical protein [Chloroflexota bacterium]